MHFHFLTYFVNSIIFGVYTICTISMHDFFFYYKTKLFASLQHWFKIGSMENVKVHSFEHKRNEHFVKENPYQIFPETIVNSDMLQCFPGLNTFLSLVLSVYLRPLKLNNGFPVTRVCYGLKMAETLIIFIQVLIISI